VVLHLAFCNLNYLLSTLNTYAPFFCVLDLSYINTSSNRSKRILYTVDSLSHGSEADLRTVNLSQKGFLKTYRKIGYLFKLIVILHEE
jgi:hypothetical protein